ncbi:MAG TPA: CAP domain-containing protein [Burkholderiaceae bacterium]|nr:CAP domain-containing protein [Burkholderiaceae bacterium]
MRHAGVYRQKRNEAYDYWIVLAAPFTVPALDAEATTRRLLALVNEARAAPRACGGKQFAAAPPLRRAARLDQAAQAHAGDMAARQVLSHTGGDGSRARDRVQRVGYAWQALGENVAAGPRNAEEALAGWLRSPGHCANVMSAEFTEMGVGIATNAASEPGTFWVQVFGTPP